MNAVLLLAIVADELEERAIAIAQEEGAHGVTVVPAHGIGFPEHVTFFGLTYRGLEKALMCVLDHDSAERIANRLNLELDLLAPFQGLAFCLGIDRAEGVDVDAIGRYIAAHRSSGTLATDDDS
ncbi:MAG TPA: hypothetical protein PKZ27_06835 [Rhodocyclaceae bacterium]|nr:hypothetical protein [Rhodocyclaceae bacterium]